MHNINQSKVSITFDPFNYLALPLPSSISRSFCVVFASLKSPLKKYWIKVSRAATISDIKAQLSIKTEVEANRIVLTEVFNHRIQKWFTDTDSVSTIQNLDLHAYEILSRANSDSLLLEEVVVPIVHFVSIPKLAASRDKYDVKQKYLFTPCFISLARSGLTYNHLREKIQSVIRATVFVEDEIFQKKTLESNFSIYLIDSNSNHTLLGTSSKFVLNLSLIHI
eukprot:TRINITY_DN7216_c0_g2_i1.p1 TRINITY_DN7216_c0_g2~~TRINITY_DN7216_c0_g2_i1.p1  ORF type:complete len:223 (-),score=19.37 TRINITY_DN7216_c0_g2_i1:23-691(-)